MNFYNFHHQNVFFGPLLCFVGQEDQYWKVSVMIIIKDLSGINPIIKTDLREIEMDLLEIISDYSFYRSILIVKMDLHTEIVANFSFNIQDKEYSFIVPKFNSNPRFMFFSCNGFHDIKDESKFENGVDSMWKNFSNLNCNEYVHLLVGGGDQIYCDQVWDLPFLKEWLKFDKNFILTMDMEISIGNFYLEHYIEHFCIKHPNLNDILSRIPYIFQWDDHDIFDGWGSYKSNLQDSKVFKRIYKIAERYYLLFQHHKFENYITPKGFSKYYKVGNCAFLGLDTRSERSQYKIISSKNYSKIFEYLNSNIQIDELDYLFIILPIPLIYPDMSIIRNFSDNLLFENVNKFIDQFGKVSYLDDLDDQWSNEKHHNERSKLLRLFHKISKLKHCRICFLTGDIHACGFGYTYGGNDESCSMYQIVSSPIGNSPMNTYLNKLINVKMVFENDKILTNVTVNNNSIEMRGSMMKLYDDENIFFLNQRNFTMFKDNKFTIHTENKLAFKMEIYKFPFKMEIYR